MERISFGQTGLRVTRIGLGLAALGRPGYIDLGRTEDLGQDRAEGTMERRAHAVLDAAWKAGVRYLDAARSYGHAERFLASWLRARGVASSDATVGSKWGYTYTAGWRVDAEVHEVKDLSLSTLRRQIAESRALLGEWLALYQIHSATLESGVLEDRDVLDELLRFRDEGLVIGLSVSGPRQGEAIRRALNVDLDGRNPFGSVQATWNVLERSAGSALAEAHDAGWGIIVKEAMANGRLAPRSAELATQAVRELATRRGVGTDRIALAAVLANPWADVVLSGGVTPEQVHSNAEALELDLAAEELEELAGLAEPPERYWATRSTLPWS